MSVHFVCLQHISFQWFRLWNLTAERWALSCGISLSIRCLYQCLGLSKTATPDTRICPADPWHRVVIQDIPLCGDPQEPEEDQDPDEILTNWLDQNHSIAADWEQLNPLERSIPIHCKATTRYLSPAGGLKAVKAKRSISMCVAFDDVRYARRLVQEGAYIHGAHCRVSIYRPMSRRPRDWLGLLLIPTGSMLHSNFYFEIRSY